MDSFSFSEIVKSYELEDLPDRYDVNQKQIYSSSKKHVSIFLSLLYKCLVEFFMISDLAHLRILAI